MDRLGFTLPDFCRVGWASDAARQRWAPVIEQIRCLWHRLEIETVRNGMRKVGLVALPRDRNVDEVFVGLVSAPLYGLSPQSMYVSDRNSAVNGDAWVVHAVGHSKDVETAVDAFSQGDDSTLGLLLGYPECCIKFFNEVWNREKYIDTTWPMAVRSASDIEPAIREYEASTMPETNMLLRWLCVRPVFHLPCSFQCQASRHVAEDIRAVATSIGQGDTVDLLYEMLQWPVQWSALHGIAEIETPVLRISTRTDATALEYKVRLLGTSKSVELAPSGTRFPYRAPKRIPTREMAIELPKKRLDEILSRAAWLHLDNGFQSLPNMHLALNPIVRAIAACSPRSVFHVSCKNGVLLRRLVDALPGVTVHGVDPDSLKIEHARLLIPEHAVRLSVCDLNDGLPESRLPKVDVCVLMLGRLLELPGDQACAILKTIRARASTVIVYAFDDWLLRASLDVMASSLGLQLSRPHGESPSVAQLI